MIPVPPDYDPHSIETEVLSLWKSRRLPPAGGVLGPPTGPTVRQFPLGWTQGDFPSLVAHRAVSADVDARYLGLAGRRAAGTLRQAVGHGPAVPSKVPALLAALGVWTGGDGRFPWDSEDRTVGVQAIVGRLASEGALVTRDESFRVCPSCGTPRDPERIIYNEQEGDTYLVRFPVRVGEWTVNAIVWVDAPWKLLGASALLLNPDLRYVVAGYRRREDRELVLVSATSLGRLRSWIPDATLEVVQEHPGREFVGIAYTYPLRHEFPMGGDLTPPAGTLLGATEVGESGTGIVPLVPGHGPTDARIATRLGVSGWPLLTPKGMLDVTLMHKYAGLDLDAANEFVLRDLSEAGALLARLRVKRGVPHCAVCGTPLLWAPGRAWCLEPSRLPPENRALFSRLLPQDTLPGPADVAPWPVSETTISEDPSALALLECAQCDRLAGPETPGPCSCGGQRTVVRRKLLPSSEAALAAWARYDPFPDGDSARLYVGQRRRVPALVNLLAALSGVEGSVPEVSLAVVPTVAAADAAEIVATHGADAVRAAMVRSGLAESAGGHFADACRREAERLRRWWSLSREVVAMCDPAMIAAFTRPISGFLGELEVEDRAILARWERTRVLALASYDQWSPSLVHRVVTRFLDNDLIEYWELVQPRLVLTGTPPTKRSALRTLAHLLRGLSEVLAPIVPFTSEAVHRSLISEWTSLFERPMAGLDRALLNDELVAAWDRWRTVLRSVDRFRRSLGVPRSTVLPSVVLVLSADDVGDRFRAEREPLARLARAQRLDVASPREPWAGRQRILRPNEAEIQKAYPAEASQIIHLLRRMAPRRWEAAAGQGELDVVINGLPWRIFPTMMAFANTLPDRVVPFPWSLGDMYLEVPSGTEGARPPAPPLSPDGFWLVRRVERRLRSSPPAPGRPPRIAIVTTKDPLAAELRALAGPVAQYLGLGELRVVEQSEEAVPPNVLTGRTRTGDRWWVHVPDLPTPRAREKHPSTGARLQRVPASVACTEAEGVDYADEKVVAHAEAVRALGQELDDLVGIPLLGPAKVAVAWDRGFHSVDDLRHSSFETVSALPGFGGPIAEVLMSKLGGAVPARAARRARRAAAANMGARPSPPLPRTAAATTPMVPVNPLLPEPRGSAPEGSQFGLGPGPTEVPSNVVSTPPLTEETKLAIEALPSPPTLPLDQAPEDVAPRSGSAISGESRGEPGVREAAEAGPTAVETTSELVVEPVEEPTAPTEVLAREEPIIVSEPLSPAEPVPPVEIPPPPSVPATEPTPEEEVPPPTEIAAPESVPPEVEETGVSLEVPDVPEPLVAVPTPPAPEATSELPPPTEPENRPTEAPVTLEPEAETTPPEVATAPQAEEEAPSIEPAPTIPAEPQETPKEAPPGVEPPGPPAEVSGAIAPALPVETPPVPVAPKPDLKPEGVATPPAVELPIPTAVTVTQAPPVVPVPAEPEPPSPPSGVELTIGDSLVSALAGFLDSTAAGHHGVCVVRESPERIRARVGSRPIEVLWLTNIGRGPSLRPSDLEGAWAYLSRKLLEEHVTAFFLEGIEYLVRLHGADAVLTGLVQFDHLARENDARIWVYLAPLLMRPADLERFRSTFGTGSAST